MPTVVLEFELIYPVRAAEAATIALYPGSTGLWLGSNNYGYVPLFDERVTILSTGLPETCLP